MTYSIVFILLAGFSLFASVFAGSGPLDKASKSAILKTPPPASPSSKSFESGLPGPNCVKDDLPCELDLAAFMVISELHSQLDDDKDGGVDPNEADGFLREELHYGGSGSSDRSRRFSRHDQHVSVAELWQRWKASSVYNWTTDDVIHWLVNHIELPQYQKLFLRQKIDGPALPKLAMSSGAFLTNVLHVRNPVHRQKIIVKAIDAILFGAPRQAHNYVKDGILMAMLCASLGGCWFAYVQYKKSQANLANMTQELDALTRKEESLIMVTQKLVEAERRQELDLQEKTVLEERYKKEVEEARAETDRLACERQSKAEIIEQLETTEKELDSVKKLLAEAERKLRTGEGSVSGLGEAGGVLPMLLQMTYETEVSYHNVKRRNAELQLVQARENCEKVRRKRAAFMGSLRIAHSTTLDDVDRSITTAKTALEEVKLDLQERQFRWTQLELITGLPIMQNPGLVSLRKSFQSAKETGVMEKHLSKSYHSHHHHHRYGELSQSISMDSNSNSSRSRNSSDPHGCSESLESKKSLEEADTAECPLEKVEKLLPGDEKTPPSLPVYDSLDVAQNRPKFSVEDNSSESSMELSNSGHVGYPTSESKVEPLSLSKTATRSKSSDQLAGHVHHSGCRKGCGKSEENLATAAAANEEKSSLSSSESTPSIRRPHSHHKGLHVPKPSKAIRALLHRSKKQEVA